MSKILPTLSFAMASLLILVAMCIDEYVFFPSSFFPLVQFYSALELCINWTCMCECASISISLLSLSSLLSHNKCVNFINDQLFLFLYLLRWFARSVAHSLNVQFIAFPFVLVAFYWQYFLRGALCPFRSLLIPKIKFRNGFAECRCVIILSFHGRKCNISFERTKEKKTRVCALFHGIHNKFYVICNIYLLRMLAVCIIINADNNSLCQKMVMILKCY